MARKGHRATFPSERSALPFFHSLPSRATAWRTRFPLAVFAILDGTTLHPITVYLPNTTSNRSVETTMKATRYPSQTRKSQPQRRKSSPSRKTPLRPRNRLPRTCGVRAERVFSELSKASPSIEGTCTLEHMMVFFTGFFARFHAGGAGYIPYELQTVDCPVLGKDSAPLLDDNGEQRRMRCVREIARCGKGGEPSWLVITWECGTPGVTMTPCGSLAEAKALYRVPAPSIMWMHAHCSDGSDEPRSAAVVDD